MPEMSFTCPPSELVSYVLEKLSFSGRDGLTLSELWREITVHLQTESEVKQEDDTLTSIDAFQRQCIWQWLFFSQETDSPLPLYAERRGLSLVIHPKYAEFLESAGGEEGIRIKPTADTQWTHLTGLEPLKKMRTQVGEKPFELLVVIAKHGAKGILSPELVREADQDPRSLPSRFKKLEEMGFIVKTSVYYGKSHQHTNHLVHRKFSQSSPTQASKDLTISRRSVGLKHVVIDAVRNATDHLRGFHDLKTELKMNGRKSGGKLFGEIIESLRKSGNVEKVMVKDPETDSSLYAIRYLKDLPKNLSHLSDYIQTFSTSTEEIEEPLNEDDLSDDVALIVPNVNNFFPVQNQLYQIIQTNSESGITSKEVVRSLSGVSGFRPWIRLLDTITSYVVDENKLVPLKEHADYYDNISIVRSFDFEGKFKIYRYFTKEAYASVPCKPHKKNRQNVGTVENLTLQELTGKYYTKLGNVSSGPYIKPSGRSKTPDIKATKKQKTGAESTIITALDSTLDSALEAAVRPLRKARMKAEKRKADKEDVGESQQGIEEEAEEKEEEREDEDEEEEDDEDEEDDEEEDDDDEEEEKADKDEDQNKYRPQEEINSSYQPVLLHNVQPILPPLHSLRPTRSRTIRYRRPALVTDSLKGRRRRSELVEMIKDLGGVTYTTAKLRRMLDLRLGYSTSTDIKTLVRDISLLITAGTLESRNISFLKTGQPTTRKVLILTDPRYRPTEDQIQRATESCITDVGDRPLPAEVRVIEGEVVLYVSKKKEPKTKGRNRLVSLDEPKKKRRARMGIDNTTPGNLSKLSSGNGTTASIRRKRSIRGVSATGDDNTSDTSLAVYVAKKHRRKTQPRKRLDKKRESGTERRVRTVYKFDKSDATTLFRAIVISKSLRRKVINYKEIAALFNDIDAKSIKQKWSVVRKSVGGLQAVSKGIEAFERIVIKGIEDELVSTEDLENVKFPFFLDLWRDADSSVLEDVVDRTPLFNSVEANLNEYVKVELNEAGSGDLFEQLEDNSMRQKEGILSAVPFFLNDAPYEIKPKQHDDLRTVLKAIFSTSEDNFSSARVKQILSVYGEQTTNEATSALIKDREMIYYGLDDSSSKFTLTDKVLNSVLSKMPNKLFIQAAQLEQHLNFIVESRKALILSQNVANGDMASIFQLISSQLITLVHIDKTYSFNGYESRLIDKEKLACDIIVVGEEKFNTTTDTIMKTPVPIGQACSHIWLDLNGHINEDLWIKIINAVLYHVHFRPGIPAGLIYGKLQAILGVRDFNAVIEWLVSSQCVTRGAHEGLWTTSKWYTVLGF